MILMLHIYIYVISLSCDLRHQKDIRPYKSNTCNATVFGQQDNEATNWRWVFWFLVEICLWGLNTCSIMQSWNCQEKNFDSRKRDTGCHNTKSNFITSTAIKNQSTNGLAIDVARPWKEIRTCQGIVNLKSTRKYTVVKKKWLKYA